MSKKASDHPKTALSTGLNSPAERIEGIWSWISDYYDAYTDCQQYPQDEEWPTDDVHPNPKPAEKDISATDAWIQAQAEPRRKGAKANVSQHLHKIRDEASECTEVQQSRTRAHLRRSTRGHEGASKAIRHGPTSLMTTEPPSESIQTLQGSEG
ncbi:MAG: hypothetical protein Q9173_005338 [Seirophora scorigena]